MCTFQPGNFTGWGSEGVNVSHEVLGGTEIPGRGARDRLNLSLRCHHHHESCIQMGSDASHLDVSD